MKEIYNLIIDFKKEIEERHNHSSSSSTKRTYNIALGKFKKLFGNFTKDDIAINKEEYLDLLYSKLYLQEKGVTVLEDIKTFSNVLKHKEIKNLQEKIEYLKLL